MKNSEFWSSGVEYKEDLKMRQETTACPKTPKSQGNWTEMKDRTEFQKP